MKYNSIQVLRGIAVMSVLILHSHLALKQPLMNIPLFSEYGWIGVRLFFVISGFIIAERIHLERSLGTYLFRRYMRVFPLYVGITVASLILASDLDFGAFTIGRTDSGAPYSPEWVSYVLKSLFIVPQDAWPVFMVGWSLEYEVVFYLAFGLAYFAAGRNAALAMMVALSLLGTALPNLTRPIFDSFFVYFLFGCLARETLARNIDFAISASPYLILLSSIAWIGHLYGYFEMISPGFVLFSGLSFAAMVVYCVSLERRQQAFRRPGFASRIGDISFSLYLVHWLVIPVSRDLTSAVSFAPPEAELIRVFVILLSLLASWVVWEYLERPMNRLTHSVFIRREGAAK